MIVVDTSVWVAAFRLAKSQEAAELRSLLDQDLVALAAPVRVEILSGASAEEQRRLRRVLSALPNWLPHESTWQLIEGWLPAASKAGQRFGAADLLIAGIAVEQGASLWSLDGDFVRLEELGLVRLFRPG